jgi:hypothetical protein
MFSLLDFGKKRKGSRKVRKGRKSVRKGMRKGSRKMMRKSGAKPPSRLLRICKKYKVKATTKRGSKRVYKSIAVLKKACIKKVKAAMKADAKKAKMAFGKRRARVGRKGTSKTRKVSKAAAMKAFRQFYKRHCAGGRGSRFGNGGNPALSASMGYQFCPSGMGGVLGAGSTGLYPSPCTTFNAGQASAEKALMLNNYSSSGLGASATSSSLASYSNMFGRRTKKYKKTCSSRRTKRKSTKAGRKVRRVKRKVRRSVRKPGRKMVRRVKRRSVRKPGRKMVRRVRRS